MALLIFTKTLGPALVFELHGALYGLGAEKLEPRVTEALDAGQTTLIFDLHKVTFIASVGLSVFLVAYRKLQGKGAVRFAGMQDAVLQVFKVTGLAARFEIYPTVDDALIGPLPDKR